MKVCFTCWLVTGLIAMLVAGRSFEQMAFASKIMFIGAILGIIGGLINHVVEQYRAHKSASAYMRVRK